MLLIDIFSSMLGALFAFFISIKFIHDKHAYYISILFCLLFLVSMGCIRFFFNVNLGSTDNPFLRLLIYFCVGFSTTAPILFPNGEE